MNAPLGLFGGTFDPVHYGHLRLAEEARNQLQLAAVRWIPAGQPAHRPPPQTTPAQRLDMVRLAIAGHPGFQLDDTEAQTDQPSYTVHTLQRLRSELGATQPLVLLLGADAFLSLTTWHRWQELFSLAHLAIATRPGSPLDPTSLPQPLATEYIARHSPSATALIHQPAGRILPFTITPLDIAATRLRQTFSQGGSNRYLLPEPVLDYISRNTLYAAPHARKP